MKRTSSPSAELAVTRDLRLAYLLSLVVAILMALVSLAGLIFGSGHLYGNDPDIVRWFRGGDAGNLAVGLPILLGTMWLSRGRSLIGLLLWPGALFYVVYTYALYLIGAPFNWLFLAYVALVTLSAYTTIGIVASIDGTAVRQHLARTPTRLVGGALLAIGGLATAALTVPVITTLSGSTPADPLLHAEWIVDYLIGNPVLLLGGILLWRQALLGYAAAAGLLFLSGANGVAFSVSQVIGALLTGSSIEVAVITVHLAIAAVSFALLTVFLRGTAGQRAIQGERHGATTG